jgi:pimeloyl-ACP methyl ester carboxylesterase
VTSPSWRELRTPFAAGRLVEAGPVRLWFHDAGSDGEPLFFLGGWTAGHFQYDFVRPYLAGYRLLTWEPRGLGPSDRPDPALNRYDLDVLSDDLRDLLQAVGVTRTHLWAGGFGSFNALRFAARHPALVGAVVTYNDVWAGDPAMAYDRVWAVYRTIVEQFGTTGLGARMLAGSFGVSDPPWFLDWEAANIEEASHPETVEALVGYGCLHADVRDDLASIEAPVLVLRGEQGWDGAVLDERDDASLRLMRERIPGLEVATVAGAHPGYAVVQRPRECAAIVREFLVRHPIGK